MAWKKLCYCGSAYIFFGFCLLVAVSAVGPPQIRSNNDSVVIDAGDDYTVLCEGYEPLKWTTPKISEKYLSWTTIITSDEPSNSPDFKYANRLTIQNMSYPFVGFYYCLYKTTDDVKNPETSSDIYLYVKDPAHLSVEDQGTDIFAIQYSEAIIPCRPTSPDVTVTLIDYTDGNIDNLSYDSKIGFSFYVSQLTDQDQYVCIFKSDDNQFELFTFLEVIQITHWIAKPSIEKIGDGYTTVGEKLVLECKIDSFGNIRITLDFETPTGIANLNRMNVTNMTRKNTNSDILSKYLIIYNASLEDSGEYSCNARDNQNHSSFNSVYVKIFDINEHFINLIEENGVYELSEKIGAPSVQWRIDIDGHPTPTLHWLNNKNVIIHEKMQTNKYSITISKREAFLKINNITLDDFGNYTLLAKNQFETKSLKLFLNVTGAPKIQIESPDYYLINKSHTIKCITEANPEPSITWFYKSCHNSNCSYEEQIELHSEKKSFELISYLNITPFQSGFVKCFSSNIFGENEVVKEFFVSDVRNGFDIFGMDSGVDIMEESHTAIVANGENFAMTCGASFQSQSEIEWFYNDIPLENDEKRTTQKSYTKYSNRTTLSIENINFDNSGLYSCRTIGENGKYNYRNMTIKVLRSFAPFINSTNMNQSIEMNLPGKLELDCNVFGIPKPSIIWLKNNNFLSTGDRIQLENRDQKLIFEYTDSADEGIYTCEAENKLGITKRDVDLKFKNNPNVDKKWFFYIIAVLVIVLMAAAIFIIIKIKKGREIKRILKMAGLANFEKGAIDNLNPDLGVDDQAELLPYDKKWEFPIEKLKLGKQLGSGAYGVVLKGEAKGIVLGENSTTVAVKMVKKDAENVYIKALASELKIMVHLGKHINIVNLLGACTKNVVKRELLVIVEYCRYGNLHNYLFRHRGNFIDQIDPQTGQIDFNIGLDALERTYSGSSQQSKSQSPNLKYAAMSFSNGASIPNEMGDYRGNSNYGGVTANTDVTLLSMTPISEQYEDAPILSNNSVQPEWRSNYRGDYKGNVKPICTKDLLTWAFQVSRGMEYLSSRKVLHGDLATRNILLAENNIVKICDFGLAKSMYKSDIYKKQGEGLLPVKWMAVESLRDRVFSVQSDVWSFGIVLWEFFSLAKSPYPGMEANERLYSKLMEGYRMEAPEFAPKQMYRMMLDCWAEKPLSRPSFSKLEERIGTLLEDSVKKHYIALNDPYLVMNTQKLENGQSDYLAMFSPPNFENLSSPHHYVNDLEKSDDHSYLCMKPSSNIFSPRTEDGTIFDFDISPSKKIKSNEGTGIELLPMLHSQSESDCESPNSANSQINSVSNPTYILPQIKNDLKSDKDIVKSADNYVNMPQNRRSILENSILNNKDNKNQRYYVNGHIQNRESVTA